MMQQDILKELSARRAEEAVTFIESLKHVKDPFHGCYFELLDWQSRIIRDVYGTLKSDGCRQYKHVYIELPKKQGKSELLGAIALKQLCADGEWYAEVYGCAADKGQASIIYDVAVAMVEQEPELKKRCKIIDSKKRIVYLPTNSFYQVLSSEAYSKHGLNVSTVLFDELHAQPNRGLYDVMTFGSGDARRQPLYWYITTAGDDPDRKTIGWEVHKKAEDILLGNRIDPTWYPVIFGIDQEENRVWHGYGYEAMPKVDWEDKRVWAMVNPSLGQTFGIEKIEEAYTNVKGTEVDERTFRQLRLNEWVKFKTSKWISLDKWDATAGDIDYKELLSFLRGRQCIGGLDLSSKIDITAYVLLFPATEDDPNEYVVPFFWIPEDNMKERVKRDKVAYDKWEKEGLLFTTPGNIIDYQFIRKTINDLKADYAFEEIGFDEWNAAQLSLDLAADNFKMVPVSQKLKSLAPGMEELQLLIMSKRLRHGGHPILRWMFGNIQVKADENNNVRPVKGNPLERIDGILAMLNAIIRRMLQPQEAPKESVYEKRGVITL